MFHWSQVEEVFHYLTPCKKILRGRRQVFDYMSMYPTIIMMDKIHTFLSTFDWPEEFLLRTGTYSTEAFNKFPFNREAAAKVSKLLKHYNLARIQFFSMSTTQYLTFTIQKCQQAAKEVSLVKWENWEDAMGLPDGWKVREYLNFCDSQRRCKWCNLI